MSEKRQKEFKTLPIDSGTIGHFDQDNLATSKGWAVVSYQLAPMKRSRDKLNIEENTPFPIT